MANDFQPNTTGAPSQAQTLLGGLIQGFGNGVENSLQRDMQLKALQQYREQMLGQKGEKQRYQEALDQARTELTNKQAGNLDDNDAANRDAKAAAAERARAAAEKDRKTAPRGSDPKSLATAQAAAHKQAVAQAGLDPKGDILSQVTSNPDKAHAYNQAYQNYMQGATGKTVDPVFDVGQTPGKYWGMNAQVKIHPGSESVLSGGGAPPSQGAPPAPAQKTAADF